MNVDDVVKIILAVGSIWPFLSVTFLIVVLVINRKKIGVYFDKLTSVKLKKGDAEIEVIKEVVKVAESKEIKADYEGKVESEVKTLLVEKETSIVVASTGIKETKSIEQVFHLYTNDKDFEKGNKMFAEIQQEEQVAEKKYSNYFLFYYLQYISGVVGSDEKLVNKILEISNDNELKAEGYNILAKGYVETGSYKKALNIYIKSLELTDKDKVKSHCIVQMSECYYKIDEKAEALRLLLEYLQKENSDKFKHSIYLALAQYYENENNDFFRALAYEKAVEIVSNDLPSKFKIAFSYSKADKKYLSYLHYNSILSVDDNNSAVLNNLGILYGHFSLNNMQNDCYKRAMELDESIAAANLAFHYIDAGFFEDARKVLEKYIGKTGSHERVISAANHLESLKKKEEKAIQELVDNGRKFHSFFKKFANSLFVSKEISTELDGIWEADTIQFDINVICTSGIISISWLKRDDTSSTIDGELNRLTSKISYRVQNKTKKVSYPLFTFNTNSETSKPKIFEEEEYTISYKDYSGYLYIGKDLNLIRWVIVEEDVIKEDHTIKKKG